MDQTEVAAASPWWERLAEWVDEWANPVLVKDLRLWLNSRAFLWMYFIALALSVLGAIAFAMLAREQKLDGVVLLPWIYGVLLVLCSALIPHTVYERFRSELSNRATELVLMSPLTARQVVRGKLYSSWCASLLVTSAAAPAVMVTYLLGGFSADMALLMSGILVVMAATMPCLQLLLATISGEPQIRIVAIMLLFIQATVALFLNHIFVFLYRGDDGTGGFRGGGAVVEQPQGDLFVAFGAVTFAVVLSLLAVYLYNIAIRQLRSPRENREAAPRVWLSLTIFVTFLVVGAFLFWWKLWLSPINPYFALYPRMSGLVVELSNAMAYAFLMLFLLLAGDGTPERMPERLQRSWPRVPGAGLLLYPGSRRLTAYGLLNFLFLLAIPQLYFLFFPARQRGISVFADADAAFRCWAPPYLAFAIGMVVHLYLVIPFMERRRLKAPPATGTLIAVNIILAFFSAFGVVGIHTHLIPKTWEWAVLAISPTGLAIAPAYNADLPTSPFTNWCLGVCGIVTILLLVDILPAAREGWRLRRKAVKPAA